MTINVVFAWTRTYARVRDNQSMILSDISSLSKVFHLTHTHTISLSLCVCVVFCACHGRPVRTARMRAHVPLAVLPRDPKKHLETQRTSHNVQISRVSALQRLCCQSGVRDKMNSRLGAGTQAHLWLDNAQE